MPTRLYFRNTAHSLSGTFPASEQSVATPSWTASGATSLRIMTETATTETAATLPGTTLATTATQYGFMGWFVSPPIAIAGTVGGGSIILNVAESETNLAANFWINGLNAYVWRPSTGTVVGVIRDAGNVVLGGLEPTSASSQQITHITGITSSGVSALSGDVIIVEVWATHTQGMGTSYSGSFHFGGLSSNVNTTENAVVSLPAGFVEFAENITFVKTASLVGTATGTAVVPTGALSNTPKSYSLVGTATGVSSFVSPEVSYGDTLLAMAFRDGSTTLPTIPAGWTSVGSGTGTVCSGVVASAIANPTLSGATSTNPSGSSNQSKIVKIGTLYFLVPTGAAYFSTSIDGDFLAYFVPAFLTSVAGKSNASVILWGTTNGTVVRSTDKGLSGTTLGLITGFTSGQDVTAIACNDTRWVAAGPSGKLAYSDDDGTSWTEITSGTTAAFQAGVYANGKFVFIANGGVVRYSTDGATWANATITEFSGQVTNDLAYANTKFVATSSAGEIATSADGVTWSVQVVGDTSTTHRSIAAGGGKVWITGNNATNQVYETADFVTWTPITLSEFSISTTHAIAYGEGKLRIFPSTAGYPNYAYTLSPGVSTTFTNATSVVCNVYRGLDPNTPIGAITSTFGTSTSVTLPATPYISKNSAVAAFVGHSSPDVSYPTFTQSTNATAGTQGFVGGVQTIRFVNNLWFIGGNSGQLSVSTDTTSFTPITGTTIGTDQVRGIAYGNGKYIAISGSRVYTSTNSTTWSLNPLNFGGLYEAAFGNGVFVVVGLGGAIYTSPDGETWTLQTTSFGTDFVGTVDFGNGVFVAGGINGKVATSTDGVTWTQRTNPFSTGQVIVVRYVNGLFFAGGVTPNTVATSPDGVNWTSQSTQIGIGNYATGFGFLDGTYYVVTSNGKWSTSTDVTTWTPQSALFGGESIEIFQSNSVLFMASLSSTATYKISMLKQLARRTVYADATNEAASYDTGGSLG